ncbi:MAG: hypothetical protein AAFQ42_02395 [Pseudomonadota bacterium]
MRMLALNYLLLAAATFAPILTLGRGDTPDGLVSVVAFASLGSLIAVALSLQDHWLARTLAHAPPSATGHVRAQKAVLILLAIGGLATAVRMFSYFDQFQLRLGTETPFVIVTAACWIAVVITLLVGTFRLVDSMFFSPAKGLAEHHQAPASQSPSAHADD